MLTYRVNKLQDKFNDVYYYYLLFFLFLFTFQKRETNYLLISFQNRKVSSNSYITFCKKKTNLNLGNTSKQHN